MKTAEIRQAFIQYFSERGHEVVDSSSLVPNNDPTLLFTNAGMVQFKDVFLGFEQRNYQAAVSVQRCVRAGGKHNDLENVGYTARHHTFFEMMGFFSFGKYFKSQAITYAWDFLTNVLKLPQERLWVTVYQDDEEAASIWLNDIKVSPKRFSRCGEKDNFWAMGDTGPCGPCTEIFYDHGPEVAGGPPGSPDADGDRYIEIWNLVFMQYNRDASGQLHPLPKPAVDTGMGLERLAAVVQGVHSNYETNDFQTLLNAIQALATHAEDLVTSRQVIADHLRAVSFLVADGVTPSNEGRGYVLRRIIRRAVRHAHYLGLPTPFFAKLLPTLMSVMGEAYPLLKQQQARIAEVLTQEEEQFARTLEQGLKLLQQALSEANAQRCLSGEVAFKLYDTYGFPLDLTEDILREQSWSVDRVGFNACMETQRAQSQAKSSFKTQTLPILAQPYDTIFRGYELTDMKSQVIGLFLEDHSCAEMNQGDKGWVILDETPFYAESGGQVGDQGYLIDGMNRFEVLDTQRQGEMIVHYGHMIQGQLSLGQTVFAEVNEARRDATRLNHTATHLLHAALKQILGNSIEQKGSLVEPLRARFDFSYAQAVSAAQLSAVEQLVNEQIRHNVEVITQVMSLEEAKNSGAVALFGEKYAHKVRVLSVGAFSKELCGGTHVKRTGDIGYFKIIAEFGVASGVRRIELLTGQEAVTWVQNQMIALEQVANLLKTNTMDIVSKLDQTLQDQREKDKQLTQMRQKLAQHAGGALEQKMKRIQGCLVLISEVPDADMHALRTTVDALRSQYQDAVLVLYAEKDQRLSLVVTVSRNLLSRVPKAQEIAKKLCEKAGGRDDMAQGGGAMPDDFLERLERLEHWLAETIKQEP